MVELFNKKYYDYEINRDLVIQGKNLEQCCMILGKLGIKDNLFKQIQEQSHLI